MTGAAPRPPGLGAGYDATIVAEADYDLAIVGGGVHGAFLALEAARRGLSPLLLERGDIGNATSANSLSILHGGLRYLQALDLRRFRESVEERAWFCTHFPDLVRPLACLLPLYGHGLHRPQAFAAALLADRLLAPRATRGLLPRGGVLTVEETAARFPEVRRQGLCGGGLWYDAVMPDAVGLLSEVVRWARASGAVVLERMEAVRLLTEAGRVTGVEASSRPGGQCLRFAAPVVVNCAGPWAERLAGAFGAPVPGLFSPALAFNLLLRRSPLSEAALAVVPPTRGMRAYFLLPWHGLTLAGTYHAPWTGEAGDPAPTGQQIEAMLEEINRAVPSLALRPSDILHVYAGLLPARAPRQATPADRARIHDHAASGGPRGLFSVSGVKFTVARRVAERVLRHAFADRGLALSPGTERPRPFAPLLARE